MEKRVTSCGPMPNHKVNKPRCSHDKIEFLGEQKGEMGQISTLNAKMWKRPNIIRRGNTIRSARRTKREYD